MDYLHSYLFQVAEDFQPSCGTSYALNIGLVAIICLYGGYRFVVDGTIPAAETHRHRRHHAKNEIKAPESHTILSVIPPPELSVPSVAAVSNKDKPHKHRHRHRKNRDVEIVSASVQVVPPSTDIHSVQEAPSTNVQPNSGMDVAKTVLDQDIKEASHP